MRIWAAALAAFWSTTGMAGAQTAMPPAPIPAPGAWGHSADGRWWAGTRAPGGWAAYRPAVRGWMLPRYWTAANFVVRDWRAYNLPEPPAGYHWSRYYDDAVLTDDRGAVFDSIRGVEWGPPGTPPRDLAPPPPPPVVAAGAPYAPPPPPPPHRDSGVTGAVVGAVAGGVAGNVIAGHGHRLGGTLIGAGAGALAGQAIARAGERRAPTPPSAYPPPAYGAAYDSPPPRPHRHWRERAEDGPSPYPMPPYPAPGAPIVQSSPGVIVRSETVPGPGGYYAGGYYYPAASMTTITIERPDCGTTTTTTEYVTERAARRVVRPVRHGKLLRRDVKTKTLRR